MIAKLFFLLLICLRVSHAQDFWEPVLPSFGFALTLAANSHGHIFASGFYRSTDGGTTWVQVNSGLPSGGLFLAVNPMNDDLIGSVGNRIYRSTNNGDIWVLQDSTTFHSDAVRLGLNNQGILFGHADTLRRSSDNGLSWTVVHNGLPFGQMPDLRVHSNGDIYVARKGDWLFRSTNNGSNWTSLPRPIGPPFFDADAIAFGPGSQIFVGDDGDGFFKSTDGGASWQQLNSGLPNTFVWALAVTSGGHIFAGMANGGIYRSTNGGAQWDSINAGLNTQLRRIYSLLIAPNGYVFAGTTGGIYRSTQPVTHVGNDGESPISEYTLYQNYPNPFNPTTTIRYELPKAVHVHLVFYDVLGREKDVLVNEENDAGIHLIDFNSAGLASGVYFYRLEAGGFVKTRKLVLLR